MALPNVTRYPTPIHPDPRDPSVSGGRRRYDDESPGIIGAENTDQALQVPPRTRSDPKVSGHRRRWDQSFSAS